MNVKKIVLMGTLTVLIGAQCWGAGNTQEELNGGLFKAARKGDTAAVLALLSDGACVNATDKFHKTALYKAADELKNKTVHVLIDADYAALIKRCPAVVNIIYCDTKNEISLIVPREVLEFIIKDLMPTELANFRVACKYFRKIVCERFENIRKLCAFRLKEKLIQRIESALQAPKSIFALSYREKNAKQATIDLLATELEAAKELDVDGLLRGEIICNGSPRLCATQIDLDAKSNSEHTGKELDESRLLRDEIICNGRRHLRAIQMDLDSDSDSDSDSILVLGL